MRTPFASYCAAPLGVAVSMIGVAKLVGVGGAAVAVGRVSASVGCTAFGLVAIWVGRLPQVQAISTSMNTANPKRWECLLRSISTFLYAKINRNLKAAVAVRSSQSAAFSIMARSADLNQSPA